MRLFILMLTLLSAFGQSPNSTNDPNTTTTVHMPTESTPTTTTQSTEITSVQLSTISYNRPKFCSNTSWDIYENPFLDTNVTEFYPSDIFVDKDNIIYVALCNPNRIAVFFEDDDNPAKTLSNIFGCPSSLFVTPNNDLYVAHGQDPEYYISKWTPDNWFDSTLSMGIIACCRSLFIDINSNIYCSSTNPAQVTKYALDMTIHSPSIVAGNGTNGSTSNMLSDPCGIFVDINLNLYVADSDNHRIQLFYPGQTDGVTVMGGAPTFTSILYFPKSIILDGNSDMYVLDLKNNGRVVKSTPNGLQCLIGCQDKNDFNYPFVIHFNNHGHFFLSGTSDWPITKYMSMTYLCDSDQPIALSTVNMNNTTTDQPLSTTSLSLIKNVTTDLLQSTSVSSSTQYNTTTTTTASTTSIKSTTSTQYLTSTSPTGTTLFTTQTTSRRLNVTDSTTNAITTLKEHELIQSTKVSTIQSTHTTRYTMITSSITTIQTSTIATSVSTNIQTTTMVTTAITSVKTFTMTTSTITSTKTSTTTTAAITSVEASTIVTSASAGIGISTMATSSITSIETSTMSNDSVNKINDTLTTQGQVATTTSIKESTSTNNDFMDSTRIPISSITYTTTMVKTSSEVQTVTTGTMKSITSGPSSSIVFVPNECSNSDQIGKFCNISSTQCDIHQPCQNMGTCFNQDTRPWGYLCACQPGFNGTNCELDIRLCKSTTCWNNGTCLITSNNSFQCSCLTGWEGIYCERKVDYCKNITCLNNGICRSLYLGYKCECLFGMHSGPYCEHTAQAIVIKQYISKSFASIAIVAISSVVIFIIALDILKYVFHIDVTQKEREQMRQKRLLQKQKRVRADEPAIALRFIYVNKSPPTEELISNNL